MSLRKTDEEYRKEIEEEYRKKKVENYRKEIYANNDACSYKYYSTDQHNHLMCLILECDRLVDSIRCTAEMTTSRQDMSYFINQVARDKNETRLRHMPRIQYHCSQQLDKAKKILIRENLFTDFIKKYPKYTNLFDIKEKEITYESASDICRSGMGELFAFLNSDFVKELFNKRQLEYLKEIQLEKLKEKEYNIKKKEENLKKEYEYMKLYNQIESSKMNSYILYKEYSTIKLLLEQYPKNTEFLNYFTNTKIAEIQKELNKNIPVNKQ